MTQESKRRYLGHLPAVLQQDTLLPDLLEPFEDVLGAFDTLLSEMERYFAPESTDPEFLPWLATWVALVLDEEWDTPKQRRLIAKAVTLYRQRGTLAGLKEYLRIYTGHVPDIREWHWPGGMQIGVASHIGGPEPQSPGLPVRIPPPRDPDDPDGDTYKTQIRDVSLQREFRDYYVVDTEKEFQDEPDPPERRPVRLYYPVTAFKRVERGMEGGQKFVKLTRTDNTVIVHAPASVTRLDAIAHSTYEFELRIEVSREDDQPQYEYIDYSYWGDSLLVDELVDQPYRFVVDVEVPAEELKSDRIAKTIDKIHAIVALEKPAHTMYYLKLTSEKPVALRPFWIGVEGHSGIGINSAG